jgi:hypothetical protein
MELCRVFRALGISKTDIGRRVALTRKSRLDRIEAALAASGKRVESEIRVAACQRTPLRCDTI